MQLPYTEVEYDKNGALVDPSQVKAVDKLLAANPTDVIVISHGWNNDPAQARALYERLIDSIVQVRPHVARAADKDVLVIGIMWPSIQWAPPDDEGAGGGAGLDDEQDTLRSEISERIEDPATQKKLQALVPRLNTSSEAQQEYLDLLRSTLPATSAGEDDAAFTALKTASAEEVMDAARPSGDGIVDAPAEVGGAADVNPAGLPPLEGDLGGGDVDGGGAGFFDSIIGAARNLLNVTTYYTMKERAGVVGTKGIATLLDHVHSVNSNARLHLVGHSFGGRAVTAAALATKAPISSMCLLQAAYSHFGMATDWDGAGQNGLFTKVPTKVDGPIMATFTRNDKAVGLAYPIASRLAQQIGAGLGDANDPYGGIGRNGALKTPGAVSATLLDVGGAYTFSGHDVWSLNGDAFITGHSDVTGPQVAYAVLSVVIGP
jgi:hypothetical protein